jgi:hypothetical protein
MAPAEARRADPLPEPEQVTTPTQSGDPLDSTVRAALNIFDGEEIEATDYPAPANDQAHA